MITRQSTKFGVATKGFAKAHKFSVSFDVRERIVSAVMDGVFDYLDASFHRITPATVDIEADIIISPPADVTYTSSNEAIATVDAKGCVTRVADGTVWITATDASGYARRSPAIHVRRVTGRTSYQFESYKVGCLAQHCADQILSRISAKTPLTGLPLYSTLSTSSATYARNANSWLSDVDITCIPVATKPASASNFWLHQGGTVISPDCIAYCNHWGGPGGSPPSGRLLGGSVRFYSPTDGVIERQIVADQSIPPDLVIAKLDADLPVTIKPAKVMPANWTVYIPLPQSGMPAANIPALGITHSNEISPVGYKQASIRAVQRTSNLSYYTSSQSVSGFDGWFRSAILYDSGHPAFLLINGELVLLSVWTTSSSGTSVTTNVLAINAAMTAMGSGYQLTTADLSEFENYGS